MMIRTENSSSRLECILSVLFLIFSYFKGKWYNFDEFYFHSIYLLKIILRSFCKRYSKVYSKLETFNQGISLSLCLKIQYKVIHRCYCQSPGVRIESSIGLRLNHIRNATEFVWYEYLSLMYCRLSRGSLSREKH